MENTYGVVQFYYRNSMKNVGLGGSMDAMLKLSQSTSSKHLNVVNIGWFFSLNGEVPLQMSWVFIYMEEQNANGGVKFTDRKIR